MKTKITSCILAIALSIMAAIAVTAVLYCVSLQAVDSEASARTEEIQVPSGSGVRSVAEKLAEKKLIRSNVSFYIAARFPFLAGRKTSFTLKSGVYSVSSAMDVNTILDLLESGRQDYIRISIPEGLTLSKIAQHLEDSGICSASSFKAAASDRTTLSSYSIPGENAEGYLFPDTYFLVPGMDAQKIVRMMIDNFFVKIHALPALEKMTPEKRNTVIVLASIVEREYRVDSEAPLIASVFTNRIKENVE